MKINIKARLKNKTFLISACTLLVSFVYKLAAIFGFVPTVSELEISELLGVAVNVLAFLGVVVDPTTEGVSDSARAMTYYTELDVRQSEEVSLNG